MTMSGPDKTGLWVVEVAAPGHLTVRTTATGRTGQEASTRAALEYARTSGAKFDSITATAVSLLADVPVGGDRL